MGGSAARRDLSTIGDTVLIAVTKDGVRFSTTGDIGSANVTVRCAPQSGQAEKGGDSAFVKACNVVAGP